MVIVDGELAELTTIWDAMKFFQKEPMENQLQLFQKINQKEHPVLEVCGTRVLVGSLNPHMLVKMNEIALYLAAYKNGLLRVKRDVETFLVDHGVASLRLKGSENDPDIVWVDSDGEFTVDRL